VIGEVRVFFFKKNKKEKREKGREGRKKKGTV
jgi:hypothetical protein